MASSSGHDISTSDADERRENERLYLEMLRIRVFENLVSELFYKTEIKGAVHLYQGQEAVAVGVCAALKASDLVATTYRSHGAALAKGVSPGRLFAELLGRASGLCGGRSGSMNIVDMERGLLGSFAIVGGSIGIATGAALAIQIAQRQEVAVAFFGDGAVNQAYFHECLNFAAVRRLPVCYICENNMYGEWTPMSAVTAGGSIARRADAYGIPGVTLDGNDVLAVGRATRTAVGRAREGKGPTLVECLTYRHKGHSVFDPGRYRPEEEVQEWLERDPLVRVAEAIGTEAVEYARKSSMEEMTNALEEARSSPFPDSAKVGSATKAKG